MRILALALWLLAAATHAHTVTQTITVDEAAARLSFPGDQFLLELPVAGATGPLMVQAELLGFSDEVVSRASAGCASAICQVMLPPAKFPTQFQDERLPLLRVRYRVEQDGKIQASGTLAVDRIAPALFEFHVFGPRSIRAGESYRVRVRAVHPLTGEPRAKVALTTRLTATFAGDARDLVFDRGHVVTDARGFATVEFKAPAREDFQSVELEVEGKLANLRPRTSQSFGVPTNTSFDLTTDKPLYQPGQTVHTRMLLLDRKGHANEKAEVSLKVYDPDSTLVYKTEAKSSHFGIATADWLVPASMRLGNYRIEAGTQDNHAQAMVRLSRYDLPTFAVNPKPDKSFYLPGMSADVSVRAKYLFGQPVLRGHVRVVREDSREWNFVAQKYDIKEGKAVEGELDAKGEFIAHVDLADEDQNSEQDPSNAFNDLHLAAYVTDASSGRTEERRFDLRVTGQALHLYVLGTGWNEMQVRGLPQKLYLTSTSADGTPTPCDADVLLLPIHAAAPVKPGQQAETLAQRVARARLLTTLHTDALGLARLALPEWQSLVTMMPAAADGSARATDEAPEIFVRAHDRSGATGGILQSIQKAENVLRVSAAKAIYRPGDDVRVVVEAAATLDSLPVTVQLVRRTLKGDIVLASQDLKLANGKATASFPADDRFTGFVFLNAFALRAQDGRRRGYQDVGDRDNDPIVSVSRALLFPRDNSLRVAVKMSKVSYRPGEEATASVAVRGPQDADGEEVEPAASALGMVAVDEAVEQRNRTDSDFGNAEGAGFFFRWRYGGAMNAVAGGISLASLTQLDMRKPLPAGVDLAAEIMLGGMRFEPETASTAAGHDMAEAYGQWINLQLVPARKALQEEIKANLQAPVTEAGLSALLAPQHIEFGDLRDPWGDPWQLAATATSYGQRSLVLKSRGPDKLPGTDDDFSVNLVNWSWLAPFERDLQHAMRAYHDRTGGFIRDQAALDDEGRAEGLSFTDWRDPWGQPFRFTFDIAQSQYLVAAVSDGDPKDAAVNRYPYRPTAYGRIVYFDRERARIENLLNTWSAAHPFPTNDTELEAAGVHLADVHDPWGHGLYATYRKRSFYTDRVTTQAQATAGAPPRTKTTITPVTEIADTITLHSMGPDGIKDQDDFELATFTRARSQQSAQDDEARQPKNTTVRSARTGALMGTVTDPTGAAIPGATVVATDADTKAEFVAKTGQTGDYALDPLPAGKYNLRISALGFMMLTYTEVQVLSPDATVLDAKLNVGSASESVTVTAEAASLETNSAMISLAEVASLSVEGRNVTELIKVLPGFAVAQGGGQMATPRLRDYFPETLVWRPEIITSPDGHATAKFKVADSITNWKLSVAASTRLGNTGAGAAQFRSFQPFFAAFDPPRILTVGDTIALPIPLHNYLNHSLSVRSALKPAAWFRLEGPATSQTTVPSGDSASPVFKFTATNRIEDASQQFTARAAEAGDSIARPVTVHPEGHEVAVTAAGVLAPGETTFSLTIPADATTGGAGAGSSTEARIRIYPNLSAHIRDALVRMVEYPGGCAEQITSTAWPSLLLEQYADRLPGAHASLNEQTHGHLEQAYANLLDKQTSDGGFAYWHGDRYADIALTAYVVRFLTQASALVTVDDNVIKRAVAWLGRMQEKDGQWRSRDRENSPRAADKIRDAMLTASVAAMIAGAPESGPVVTKALAGIDGFADEFDEPYTVASYALAAIAVKDTAKSAPAIARLRTLALSENGGAYWKLETNTPFFGWGRAGRVEATAQVLRALLAAGANAQDDLVGRGLLFLAHEQDRYSMWYSTQATARVLDVLAAIGLSADAPAQGPAGEISVSIDGAAAGKAALPMATADAGPIYLPLAGAMGGGEHRVTITLPATAGTATAQVVASVYRPWPQVAAESTTTNNEQLRLTETFSTTAPPVGEKVEAGVHIERIGFRGYGMLIAEIGLPPGADVDRASLESAVKANGYEVNAYEVLPDRVLLYLWPRAGGVDLKFKFTLRYGVSALTAPSTVYDYYNPDSGFDVPPVRFVTR